MSPVEFVLDDRNRVICMEGHRTEADDERIASHDRAFFLDGEVLIVREHEGRVRGKGRAADVLAAFFQIHEGRPEAIERLHEGGLRGKDAGRGLPFHARRVFKGPADERCIAADVRLIRTEAEALQAYETGRVRWAKEEKADFDIATDVMRKQETRVRGAEENVHPPRGTREVAQRERRRRGRTMSDDEEATHDERKGRGRLRLHAVGEIANPIAFIRPRTSCIFSTQYSSSVIFSKTPALRNMISDRSNSSMYGTIATRRTAWLSHM